MDENRIKEIRKEKGYSQVELAKRCGISVKKLQKIERDIKKITEEELYSLSKVLGVPEDYLMHWSDQCIPLETAFRADIKLEECYQVVEQMGEVAYTLIELERWARGEK